MRAIWLCITLAGLVLGAPLAADAGPALDLASGGKSSYRIAIPEQPKPVVRDAAAELQVFLKQVTGAKLPIVPESSVGRADAIFVGCHRRATRCGSWR